MLSHVRQTTLEETMCAKKQRRSVKKRQVAGNPAFDVGSFSNERIGDPVRCGVVGLGRIGWNHHCQIVMSHNGFELVAVCDLEEERVQEAQKASGCRGYRDVGKLLQDKEVELVVIATQSKDHEPMALRSSRAGKHVLVEKPAARTANGIDRMNQASRKAKRLFTVHHNYRLNPEYLFVREVVDSGVLGPVFRLRRRVGGFSRRNDWQTLSKYGGGMLGNWGVHLVDAGLQFLRPPIVQVWGHLQHLFNPGDAEDDIKAVIQDKKGVVLDIEMTSVDASDQPGWVVCGRWGTLWLQGKKAYMKRFDPKKIKKLKPNDLHYAPERRYGVIPGPDEIPWMEQEMAVEPKKQVQSYYDRLYLSLRKKAPLLVTPESARLTYEVLARIRRGSGF